MYPKKVSLFVPWSKAMVAGATVDKPNYGKMTPAGKSPRRKRRTRRRKRGKKHAQKD